MLKNLLLAVGLAVSVLPAWSQTVPAQPKPGDIPPQALGKQWQGGPIDLGQYRGKVVIVTFWASWCGPCRRELPVLSHFQKTVGRDALQVFAINYKEPREDFNAIVRANRNTLDLDYIHDGRGVASDLYGVVALPNMFILDQEGKVAFVHRGYSEEALPEIIQQVLSLLPEEVRNRPAQGV